MENLLAPQQPAQGAPQQPAQGAPQQPAGDEAMTNAVLAALDILYEPDVIKVVNESLAVDAPAKAAGDLAARLIIQADEKNNDEMPDEVIVPAAAQVLEEIIAYIEDRGIGELTPDDDQLAANAMMRTLGEAYGMTNEQYSKFGTGLENNPEVVQASSRALQLEQQSGGLQ